MKNNVEPLSQVIKKLQDNEILLPDFQRNFVWKEEDRQKKLIASVLAKMPVGSVLLLNSPASDFAYKKIGLKARYTSDDLNVSGEISALLDGQQRLTVLTNAFSNTILESASQVSDLIGGNSLKRRFFLKIPSYNSENPDKLDYFNSEKLSFPWNVSQKDEPNFLADDIYDAICIVPFNAADDCPINPFRKKKIKNSELISYCTARNDYYLIPLYLLNSDANLLTTIIDRIVENIESDILQEYSRIPDAEGRQRYIKNKLTSYYYENMEDSEEENSFKSALQEQGKFWAQDMQAYLNSCLNDIQLNQIIVDNSDRARAINIYENLNMGGISLGTFELIMARYASLSQDNYYDILIRNILTKRNYDYSVVSHGKLKNNTGIKQYVESDEYIAAKSLKCLNEEEGEIVKTYIDVYLDVLSLFSYVDDFDENKIKIDMIKKNKILSIPPDDLVNKCDKVCTAIDQALFFFQMRCGIRSIKEINYNLMLVVVAYILLNDEFAQKSETYDYLEAWYWASIFSGYFSSDQTERSIASIQHLINAIRNNNTKWIKDLQNDMFSKKYFSDKDFLLLKNQDGSGLFPKEFLSDIMCQFYLSESYKGLFDQKNVNAFDSIILHKHHVIPLGSQKYDSSQKIAQHSGGLRKDKGYFLNSPANFIYISDHENTIISSDSYSDYANRINNPATRHLLGFHGNIDTSTEDGCKALLSDRLDHFIGELDRRMEGLV